MNIEQLEKLAGDGFPLIRIEPNGEVVVDTANCPCYEKCRAALGAESQPASTNKQSTQALREIADRLERAEKWGSAHGSEFRAEIIACARQLRAL